MWNRLNLGSFGDHHESGEFAVGFNRPHPWNVRSALVRFWKERVGVRVEHRADELGLARSDRLIVSRFVRSRNG